MKKKPKMCEGIIIDQFKDLTRHRIAVTRIGRKFVSVEHSFSTDKKTENIICVSPIKILQVGARVKFNWWDA